jgi:alpha-1,6-mannosyltransferase
VATVGLEVGSRDDKSSGRDRSSLRWRVPAAISVVLALIARSRVASPEPTPYLRGVTRTNGPLVRAALFGTVASVAIFLGATQSDSPFTEKLPGSWFFGIPAPSPVPSEIVPPGQGLFLGVVAVYGGMLLMLRAWSELARLTARYPGMPVRHFWYVFAAWVAPLLVIAPLFSKDVYSYVAQGEQMTHGINPYLYGPNVLGATTFSRLVDPLWGNVSSPYGPVFIGLAGAIVSLAHHHELAAVLGMRALALGGTVMFGVAIPVIARSYKRDGSSAFVLAALNPLVLLNLIAGAHNDALMIGLLAIGIAFARRGRPIIGLVFVGVAAAVKVPALLGALYIGWDWLGADRTTRDRIRPAVTALGIALGVMAVLSEIVGLGWGWIRGLSNPDTVWSWMSPPTGLGLAMSKIVSGVGLGSHTQVLLTIFRSTGLVLAALLCLRLLVRSPRIGTLKALGWSFVLIVELSPVVEPWYLAWGFVFLAPVVEGRGRRLLVILSGIACFVGLPSGHVLWDELSIANPALLAVACLALVAIAAMLGLPRARRLLEAIELDRVAAETAWRSARGAAVHAPFINAIRSRNGSSIPSASWIQRGIRTCMQPRIRQARSRTNRSRPSCCSEMSRSGCA